MATIDGHYKRYNGSGWDEIKFPPASHTHGFSDITNRTTDYLSEPSCGLNTPTVTTMSRVENLRANRFAGGLHPSSIIVEESTDAGSTWTVRSLTNSQKLSLFNSNGYTLTMPQVSGKNSCTCMLRITLSGIEFNDTVKNTAEGSRLSVMTASNYLYDRVYATVSDIYFWLCGCSDYISITVQGARGSDNTTWTTYGTNPTARGWSGMDTIHLSSNVTFGGGSTQTSNNWFLRFIFRTCANDGTFDDSKLNTTYATSKQSISNILGYGASCYAATNYMGKLDRAYQYSGLIDGTYGSDYFLWNGSFVPDTSSSRYLGTYSNQWKAIYGTTIYENGTSLANTYATKTYVDGLMGDLETALAAIIG